MAARETDSKAANGEARRSSRIFDSSQRRKHIRSFIRDVDEFLGWGTNTSSRPELYTVILNGKMCTARPLWRVRKCGGAPCIWNPDKVEARGSKRNELGVIRPPHFPLFRGSWPRRDGERSGQVWPISVPTIDSMDDETRKTRPEGKPTHLVGIASGSRICIQIIQGVTVPQKKTDMERRTKLHIEDKNEWASPQIGNPFVYNQTVPNSVYPTHLLRHIRSLDEIKIST